MDFSTSGIPPEKKVSILVYYHPYCLPPCTYQISCTCSCKSSYLLAIAPNLSAFLFHFSEFPSTHYSATVQFDVDRHFL